MKGITAFLSLGTLYSTSAPHLRIILNNKITNEKHKNVENVALNRQWKDSCFLSELKQVAEHGLVGPQLAMCSLDNSNYFATLSTSTNDHESATTIDFRITNKV